MEVVIQSKRHVRALGLVEDVVPLEGHLAMQCEGVDARLGGSREG